MRKVLEPQIKMSLLRKSIKGTVELSAGQVLTYGCSFVRLAILARVLSTQDFGIAATFAMTIALLETSSNLSIRMLIVQSKNGDSLSFQGTGHLLLALRGVVNSILLFLLAWPISHLFSIPDARWAFQCLAVVPLLRGFVHLDINRVERKMNFRPRIITEVAPQILVTAAAWPFAVWLGDYSALLWLLLAKACFTLMASHLLATRPYRWNWHKPDLREIFGFAWPLLLNGTLLFLISQGDRFVVGISFSMSEFAFYAAASTLVTGVLTMVLIIHGAVMLPNLSRVKDRKEEFGQYYNVSARVLVAVSVGLGATFIVAGGPLMHLIYGHKFAVGGTLVAWLGAGKALACVRAAPTTAALAHGDSKCVLYSNIAGATGLLLACIGALLGYGINWFAISVFLGELVSLFACVQLLSKRHGAPTNLIWRPSSYVALSMLCAVIFATTGFAGDHSIVAGAVLLAWTAALCCLLLWFPMLRNNLKMVFPTLSMRFGVQTGQK